MRPGRIKHSILASSSLALSVTAHEAAGETIVFSADALDALSENNGFNSNTSATTLDFRNLTTNMTVGKPFEPKLDLSMFSNVRNIVLPWFAAKLNITLPENFFVPKDNYYSVLKFIEGSSPITSQNDQILDLQHLLDHEGKVRVDTTSLQIKELISGRAGVKLSTASDIQCLTVADTLEYIDTNLEESASTPNKKVKLLPRINESDRQYFGVPDAVSAFNPAQLDLSEYNVNGKDINVAAIKQLGTLVTRSGDCIGKLTITGERPIALNGACTTSIAVSSSTPDPDIFTTMGAQTQQIIPMDRDAHAASFSGETDLDFSNLDLGSIEATAARIKYILDTTVPLASITSLKIKSTVLSELMTRLGVTSLTGFSSLERLDIIDNAGKYESSSLTKAQLPASIQHYYSKDLVVVCGTLDADLTIDAKFNAATLDFCDLTLNGYNLIIDPSFTGSNVTTLYLSPPVAASAAATSLMQPGSNKTLFVYGTASGVLDTSNLPNAGTIDLRNLTGATSFSTPLDVDGGHTLLKHLYLPTNFDMTTPTTLSGLNNGEAFVYFSGNYVGNIALNAGYTNARLKFADVTGAALLQLPSGIRCLTFSDGISGANIGAPAVANEFDLTGLTHLETLTDIPLSATLFEMDNNLASAPMILDIRANTALQTMNLHNSRIAALWLPISPSLIDGGGANHLDLSNITDLGTLIGLNELLNQGVAVPVTASNITDVSFPLVPAPGLTIDLTDTREGVNFTNLNLVPHVVLDATYINASSNMWPTVPDKSESNDWVRFLNYIIAPDTRGGLDSPSLFDLSGQIITNQAEADALVTALNALTITQKGALQTLIIRLDTGAAPIDFSSVNFAPLTEVIVDKINTTTSTVTYPGSWTNIDEHLRLTNVNKSSSASWLQYLDYRFSSIAHKGEGATSLDLSSMTLTAAEWTALMGALDTYPTPADIQTIYINLAPGAGYAVAPAFTTAALSALTELIVDITGVTNAGTQVGVTGLPAATVGKVIEQRVTTTADVDHTSATSWQGYFEHLLTNIGGTSYVLDLTTADLQLASGAELTALNTALAAISDANKAKIQDIKLKLASGNIATDFNVTTDLTNFANLATFTVDATGALNGTNQSIVTYALTNAPAYVATHVSDLSTVDTDQIASWEYYFTYRIATAGLGLTNLDMSSISIAQQADLTAFLSALHNQSGGDKSTVQNIKLKIDTNYPDAAIDFGVDLGGSTEVSGFTHGSFKVTVDRNGANPAAPVPITYGSTGALGTIRTANTSVDDTAFNGLATFDGTSAHQWLGYMRTLLGAVATGSTTTLDLSTHAAFEINNARIGAFITAMNSLPIADKEKIATLKIHLTSGDFGAASANFSSIAGLTNLANMMVNRNGARVSGTLYHAPVSITGPIAPTITDPEVRTITNALERNQWLGKLRFILNGMSGTANVVDLTDTNIPSDNASTAFSNALHALPDAEKLKIQKIKLASATNVTLGNGVSGLDNLTHVIVDQTANPLANFTVNGPTAATGEFADAIVKYYVTDATAAQASNQWDEYLDYVLSSVADGGLGQTTINLSSLQLNNAQASALFGTFSAPQAVATTGITVVLNPTFGAATLTLPAPGPFTSLTGADAFQIYRNNAKHTGDLISIDYNGWSDAVVQLLDVEASTVGDTANQEDWLGYLTNTLRNAPVGTTLDLSSIPIDDAAAVTAFNTAMERLDSALKNKVNLLQLNVTHAADITLGTGVTGWNILDRVEILGKPGSSTLTFAGALAGKRTYIKDITHVKQDNAADWERYFNYQLSTTQGGQSATTLDLNAVSLLGQDALNALFAGLNALNNAGIYGDKSALTTLRLTLTDGLNNMAVGRIDNTPTAATGLNANLRVIVDPGTSTNTTHAGAGAGQLDTINLIVLDAAASFDRDHIAYLAEQPGFNGLIDLSALSLNNQAATTAWVGDLNALPADIKSKIKQIDLTLTNGNFGAADIALGALSGFSGLTINIDRNGAHNGASSFDSLVTLTNGTGHTVNLADNEFNDFSTFDNTDSAQWVGYLTHVLNTAPNNYTLDLSINDALAINSANALTAFNEALKVLTNKTKVTTLKLATSLSGEIGTNVTGYTNLANVIVDYTTGGVANMTAHAGFGSTPTLYHYLSAAYNGTSVTDWTRVFDYKLNAVANHGLALTDVTICEQVSSAQLAALLSGLDAAASKAMLQNLTLNLTSTVTGDVTLSATGLAALTNLSVNSNGSAAKLIPSNSFAGATTFAYISNVKANDANSWDAYLAGQPSIASIDIRDVLIASQAELTAFLTALQGDPDKATTTDIKLKLDPGYAGTIDFSAAPLTGMTALTANDSVETYRNGSTATPVAGGEVALAKVSIIDTSTSYITDRNSSAAWQSYLNNVIQDGGFGGVIDLSLDPDTYLRTNAQLSAFMSGLFSLSSSNKLAVTDIKLKLAQGNTWTNITDLGQFILGFTNLTSFNVDASGAYTVGGDQATLQFHADLNSAAPKALVTDTSSIDKDSVDSWGYFINNATLGGASALDISGISLNTTELAAFDTALDTFSTTAGNGNLLNSLHLTVSGAAGAATVNITADLDTQTAINSADKFKVNVTGFVDSGTQATVAHTGGTPKAVQNYIANASNIYRTSTDSWDAYLNLLYPTGIPTLSTVDLSTDSALYLRSQAEINTLISALETRADKGNIASLDIKLYPQSYPQTLVIGNGSTGFNPAMTIDATGAVKHAKLLMNSNIAYAGSFDATGKTIQQDYLTTVSDPLNVTQWETYLNYYLSHISEGGKAYSSIVVPALNSGAELSAFMTALDNLSPALKAEIEHLHFDISAIAGAVELGTGVAGLTSLNEVTYIRASAEADATAAVGSDFVGTTQRLRTVFNGNTAASATTMEEFLRYQLIETVYGGLERSAIDATNYAINTTEAGYLNTAIGNLPAALKAQISEILLNLNAATGFTFNAAGLTNLSSVKYFQTGAGAITWTGTPGFGAATKTLFRDLITDIVDLDSQAEWEAYLKHKLLPAEEGGLAATTLDITGTTLVSSNVTAFMNALNAIDNADLINLSELKLNVSGYAAGNLTLTGSGGKTYNNALNVRVYTDAAHTGTISLAGTMTGGSQTLWQFVNAAPAVTDAAIAWQRWLNYQLSNTVHGGAGNTALDLTGSHAFGSQGQIDCVFAGLQALTGTTGTANKNLLTDLDLKLASGDFGSDVVIGETGAGPTSGLNAGINVSVDRNGALNGANTYDPLVTISFTGGTNGGTETVIDASSPANPTLDSSNSWLAYLIDKLTVSDADTTLDLTPAALTLTGANDASALTNALQALSSTLKNKVKGIKIKSSAASVTVGTGVTGFTNLTWVDLDKASTDSITLAGVLGGGRTYISDMTKVNQSSAVEWSHYANYLLSGTADGGQGSTMIDVASPTTLNHTEAVAFFDGLDLLNGTGVLENKNTLTSISIDLVNGEFGAAALDLSPRSGYSALVLLDINRNGAVNSGDPISIILGSGAGTLSSSIANIENPQRDGVTPGQEVTLNDAQDWLEYFTYLTSQSGFDDTAGNDGLIDLSGGSFQLTTGDSQNEGNALITGLENLDPTLKSKIKRVKLKLASGSHGAGNLTLSGDLSASNDFSASLEFLVDVEGANNGGGLQKALDLSGLTVDGNKAGIITDITQVILSDANSWGYHLNHLADINGNLHSIDLVGQSLWQTNQTTTQNNLHALFTAINARSDKSSIKDIFIDLNGQGNGNNLIVGETSSGVSATGLTSLTSVIIKDGSRQQDVDADGTGISSDAIGFILSATHEAGSGYNDNLGDAASIAQWIGYIAYLFEDATHGGIYTGQSTFSTYQQDVQPDFLTIFQNLEQAFIQLPIRIKQRISVMHIKMDNTSEDFSPGGYGFGQNFTAQDITDYSALRVVLLDTLEENNSNRAEFPTSGPLYDAVHISKIRIRNTSTTEFF